MGLRTSWSKTKLQNIASGSVPTAAFIDGQCVEVVDSFLLGSEITSSGYSSCDIIHCIGLASWTVSGVIANSACPLTCAFTTAVFWHCCCTVWTILKANRQKLQSFHLRCQRRKLQIRWSDFVTNADVSARTSLTDVHSIISQTRHALFGHIQWLPPDTPAHKIGGPPHGSPNAASSFRPDITWRRPPGRSRSTWLQQLTDDIGISASRLWDSAADLSEWAALRPIAGLID